MKSGYSLKEVVNIVDSIDFHALDNHHAMSVIYESLLAQTADAGWSGELYSPRPVVEAMVRIVNPTPGETEYVPCSGSRSVERRVGKAWVRRVTSWWVMYIYTKKQHRTSKK